LLENNFITYNKGGLNQIYNELLEFSNIENESEKSKQKKNLSFADLSNLNPSFLEKVNEVNKKDTALFFATDLPVYLESTHKKNAPTIMVCAMDSLPPVPLKDNKNQYTLYPHQNSKIDLRNNVGFWAPFSLVEHNNDDNAKFFKALLTQYNVYVTDVYKLFFYIDKNKINEKGEHVFNKSNGLLKYKKLQSHKNILIREINIINPSCIITLGNNAGNAILNLEGKSLERWDSCLDFGGLQKNDTNKITESNKSIKIISMPHISGAANGNKTRLIDNDFYKNIPGETIEKYANILLHEIAITIGLIPTENDNKGYNM
jgi:uracil-DNA glycosylase